VTKRKVLLLGLAGMSVGFCGYAVAQEQASSTDNAPSIHTRPPASTTAAASAPAKNADATATKSAGFVKADDGAMRIEGEKRFRTNCGRCHMAPHKFPPRTMTTIIRHMRVRAMITDEDMRLILRYITQ